MHEAISIVRGVNADCIHALNIAFNFIQQGDIPMKLTTRLTVAAALAMSLSSVSVISNALRLKGVRL